MTETSTGIARRTLAKGAAWAVPTVAVAAAAPVYAASGITTLPPCIGAIAATGGSYPVTFSLSGCSTANSHWDFRFEITASTVTGTDCNCPYLRVTFFDNPKRSRLWISTNNVTPNPSTNTANSPRLYVQKVLAAGASADFPATGDPVYRVAGPAPYAGYTPGGTLVGSIVGLGQADDTLHVLVLPGGGVPCSASGPMAYYQVECGQSQNGPWTPLGGRGEINPCVPMIEASVCRFDTTGNDRYRLGISVLNSCGIAASNFKITNIQRNSDTNFPAQGSSVWSPTLPSTGQSLNAGVTNIDMTTAGAGTQLWISFTTDNGNNTSQIRVPTNDTSCAAGRTSETSTTTVAETSAAKFEETTTTTVAATTTTTVEG